MSGAINLAAAKAVSPAALYHTGTTARLRSMEPGEYLDFDVSETNRVRGLAHRVKQSAMFVSRSIRVDGRKILRVWRLM